MEQACSQIYIIELGGVKGVKLSQTELEEELEKKINNVQDNLDYGIVLPNSGDGVNHVVKVRLNGLNGLRAIKKVVQVKKECRI